MRKKGTFGSVSQWSVITGAGSSGTKPSHEGREKREGRSEVERASGRKSYCELGHAREIEGNGFGLREENGEEPYQRERERERESVLWLR